MNNLKEAQYNFIEKLVMDKTNRRAYFVSFPVPDIKGWLLQIVNCFFGKCVLQQNKKIHILCLWVESILFQLETYYNLFL